MKNSITKNIIKAMDQSDHVIDMVIFLSVTLRIPGEKFNTILRVH